jgi:sugar phosphate isomerase/epimerase
MTETLDGYRRAADQLNRAAEQARSAGMRVGFHNHAGEFAPMDGRIPYDVLLEETDPQLVWFEMDLYWIRRGGGDALAYFARHPGRFATVHVKDMDNTPERGMVDVGAGIMDFKALFARREQAGIRHFFVEHDRPTTPLESIRTSYQYLRQLEF